jgi:hypothetical protein
MTTREAFEAWASSVTPVPVVRRIEDNVIAWYAWQAATLAERERAAIRGRIAQLEGKLVDDEIRKGEAE